jgi:hypothetical protein
MDVFMESDIEKKLEDVYAHKFQWIVGMSPSQAKRAFRDLLKNAREESLEEGTSNLPLNFGEILLEKESTDEKIKSWLAMKRNEGVRDEDIREWWNMHDLERRILLGFDHMTRFSQLSRLGWGDQPYEGRIATAGKFLPIYGDPNEPSYTAGDDRPLPYELKNRVNRYLEIRIQTDPIEFRKEVEKSSTLNALIRREIKRGTL